MTKPSERSLKKARKTAVAAIKEIYGEDDWKHLKWACNEGADEDADIIAKHFAALLDAEAAPNTPPDRIAVSREMLEPFVRVAASEDNEGTDTPQWFVIDPRQNMRCSVSEAASQFVGPFFSRERAELYLKNRRYEYGPKACVWCSSGYWAQDYKDLYKASKALSSIESVLEGEP